MKKARILIVEDEAIIAMEIENQLLSLGYEVTSIVDTGEKTIKKTEVEKPDLILMDIRIKGEIDGVETAEVIRNKFGIPVVFSTAYLDEKRIERAKITMPFGYVLKPVQERDLKVTIEMALYVSKVDRKRTKAEKRFRTIFEEAPLGVALIDSLTGHIYEVNPKFAEIAGRAIEEMETIDWMKITHPDDIQEDLDNMVLLNEGKIPGFNMNKRYIRPDGSFVWINMTIAPVTVEDKSHPRHLCMIEDITESKRMGEALKKNEEWFSTTLRSIGDAVITTDMNSRVTLLNPVAESLTGWKQKEAFGKPLNEIFNIINESTKEPVDNPVEKVIKENRIAGLANHTLLLAKDGKVIPIDDSASPIRNDDGITTGVVLVFRDITYRKQAERALQESEFRVKRKLKAILDPESDIGSFNLADLIDTDAVQSMMDDFFKFTNLLVAVLDVDGKVLVSSGWQDICTKFHRTHPEAAKYCTESDIELSKGVSQGEFKIYKCKNNLWDISTPITIGEKHLGNVFFGQFFFDDEKTDRKLFISQAKRFGFNQTDYLTALDQVPRLSREKVDHLMSFYSKFATNIAKQAYSNLKLARALNQNGQ